MSVSGGLEPQIAGRVSAGGRSWRSNARFWYSLWYFVVVIASAGLFAAVPFAHAATRLRRPSLWFWTAVYAALDVLMVILMSLTPRDAQNKTVGATGQALSTIGGLLALAIIVVACFHLRSVRREVYRLPTRPIPGPPVLGADNPAVAAVLAARAQRQEARELATRDPMLARELRIGRPDLTRQYDDGGLVDLNNAPAHVIVQVCEVTPDIADKIVAARTQLGGSLSNVDELFVLADLPVSTWERLRDRAVLLPN